VTGWFAFTRICELNLQIFLKVENRLADEKLDGNGSLNSRTASLAVSWWQFLGWSGVFMVWGVGNHTAEQPVEVLNWLGHRIQLGRPRGFEWGQMRSSFRLHHTLKVGKTAKVVYSTIWRFEVDDGASVWAAKHESGKAMIFRYIGEAVFCRHDRRQSRASPMDSGLPRWLDAA
jgi:hypothetical protein